MNRACTSFAPGVIPGAKPLQPAWYASRIRISTLAASPVLWFNRKPAEHMHCPGRSAALIVLMLLVMGVVLGMAGCLPLSRNLSNQTQQAPVALPYQSRMIILMYHRIVAAPPAGEYDRTVADFLADIKWLKASGYTAVSLADLIAIREGHIRPPSGKLFAITFDDGYQSMYQLAFPILAQENVPAWFFLITDFLSSNPRNTEPASTPSYMNWMEVAAMAFWGNGTSGRPLFGFGSHTTDHPFLKRESSRFNQQAEYSGWLDQKIQRSASVIKSYIPSADRLPMILSLPFGDGEGDPAIINSAKRAGYRAIRTSRYGSFDPATVDLYLLPSLPVLGNTDIQSVDVWINR